MAKKGIDTNKTRKGIDKSKLAVRIVAATLAGLMVLSFAGTVIYYLVISR